MLHFHLTMAENKKTSIVKNIRLLGQASIESSRLTAGYKTYLWKAICDRYEGKNYNWLEFEDYCDCQHDSEATRQRFEDLAAILDEKLHRKNVCLFVEKVYMAKFLPDYERTRYKEGRTHFIAQFMARVLHIKPGDRHTMRILGFANGCMVLEARKVMIGYIIRPDLSTERDGFCYAARGTIAYTLKEAKEMQALKIGQYVRVEFEHTPTVSGQKPEKVICACRYISTVRRAQSSRNRMDELQQQMGDLKVRS